MLQMNFLSFGAIYVLLVVFFDKVVHFGVFLGLFSGNLVFEGLHIE
jgi:hypothetical protein